MSVITAQLRRRNKCSLPDIVQPFGKRFNPCSKRFESGPRENQRHDDSHPVPSGACQVSMTDILRFSSCHGKHHVGKIH
jgi:hypothetical protein